MLWRFLRKYFFGKCDIDKIKPAIVFNVIFGVSACVISTVTGSFVIGFIGSYSIIIAGFKIHAVISYGKSPQKEQTCVSSIFICVVVLTFLHFAFTMVTTFFWDEPMTLYLDLILYFMAVVSFVNVFLNSILSIVTRKNHNAIIHQVKLADFAGNLIALAVLQRTIMYFVNEPNAKIASCAGGLFFSVLSALVCIYMYRVVKKSRL
jgi:hypothetical protein